MKQTYDGNSIALSVKTGGDPAMTRIFVNDSRLPPKFRALHPYSPSSSCMADLMTNWVPVVLISHYNACIPLYYIRNENDVLALNKHVPSWSKATRPSELWNGAGSPLCVQVISGEGLPLASHLRITMDPTWIDCSKGVTIHTGGTVDRQRHRKLHCSLYVHNCKILT
jgi:hypothetical protein